MPSRERLAGDVDEALAHLRGASPQATESPLSAHQPSRISPQSSETRSPSLITWGPGMPWTTWSLIDTQSELGKSVVAEEPRDAVVVADEGVGLAVEFERGHPRHVPSDARCARQAPRMRPEMCIFAISSGCFRRNPSTPNGLCASHRRAVLLHRLHDPGGDRVDISDTVDRHDARPGGAIVLEDRSSVLAVHDQTLGEPLRGVVTPPFDGGSFEDPGLQLVVRDLEGDDIGNQLVALPEHRVEHDRLGHGARETVQQHAALGVRLVETAVDHPDDQVVGHEPARIHDRLRLAAQGGVASHLAAEHVARGHVRHAELHRNARCLGALTAAGRPDPERDHLMNPLYWRISSWVSICFMVSSATPTTIRIAVPPR